jgi:hypothetical protein
VVVVTAVIEGDLRCLTDDDGAIEIFYARHPEVRELVEAARDAFGSSARAMPAGEFRALAGAS